MKPLVHRLAGAGLSLAAALALAAPASARVVAFASNRCADEADLAQRGSVPSTGLVRTQCHWAIWSIDEHGGAPTRITDGGPRQENNGPSTGDLSPSFSGDGRRIAYEQTRPVEGPPGSAYPPSETSIWTMNSDGSNQRRISPPAQFGTTYPAGDFDPTWSPDGKHIAFGVADDPACPPARHAFLMAADGANRVRLTSGPYDDRFAFTPGGERLVIQRGSVPWCPGTPPPDPAHSDFGLYTMKLDGSDLVPLSTGGVGPAWSASFSPDGQHIALTVGRGDNDVHVFTMRSDGTELTQQTAASGESSPIWSPDGRTLVYQGLSPSHEAFTLFALDVARSGAPPLALTTSAPGTVDESPSWSPAPTVPLLPRPVESPPALALGDGRLPITTSGSDTSSARAAAARGPAAVPRGRLQYLALDRSGVRRVEASFGRLAGHGRCRFLGTRGLAVPRPCGRPRYVVVHGPRGWRALIRRLAPGAYVVRLRARDGLGHTTRRPRSMVVRLR